MNEQRYRSTAGPALASMDNWNAQQNRRPAMQMSSEDRAVPEPDVVHAVHEAIANNAPDWIIDREDGELFDMARAALAALAAAKGTEDEQEDCGCTSIDYGWYGNDGGIVNDIQCSDEGCPRAAKGTEGSE